MGNLNTDLGPQSWNVTTWGELVELKYGKGLKGYRESKGAFPVYGTNGPVGWCEKPLCDYSSVIVGRKGAYRGVHFSDKPFYVIDTAFYIQPKIDINLKWAYYSLLLADINGMDSGSAIPSTSREDFYAIPVRVPPRAIQESIVYQLDMLDNKIQLNRQTNQTLEQMAQALFKSWFVDFDPVIDNALAADKPIPEELQARAQCRQQQLAKPDHQPLPDDVRQLFPSEFEETEELGWVPKGWKSKKLPEVIDFLEGPGIRNWQYTNSDEGVKFINIRCIQGGDLKLETANRITKEEAFGKYAHFQLKEHDLVISTSGTLGRFSFVREEHLPLSLNTSVIRFRAIDDVSTLQFIAGYCATGLQWELGSRATGSAQLNFGPMHLKKISMLLPSYNVLLKYEEIADLFFTKKQVNLKQIDKLTKLRDTLLPKLISGELRLPESMLDSETKPSVAESAYE